MSIQSIGTVRPAPDVRGRAQAPEPTLIPVGETRWRVVMNGRIIGHLDDLTDAGGARFRASRYRRATGSLVSVGDFFRRRDAIDALRYAG